MDHVLHNYLQAGAIAGALAGAGESISDAAAATSRKTRLLQDFVCLKFPDLPKSHVTAAGVELALPDNRYFQSTMRDAVVVAVGPGKWFMPKSGGGKERGRREHWHPTTVRVGDRVLIDAMHTQEGLLDEWDGERGDFRVVRESAIDGVLLEGAEVRVA